MHPKHVKIKINISACLINLFYTSICTRLVSLEGLFDISPQRNQSQACPFLLGKWQLFFDTYLLSHFIRISHRSGPDNCIMLYPSPFTIICMILAYFLVFHLWIRWLSAVIDCISSHQFTQLSLGFMRSLVLLHWHEWLSVGSMSWAKWTASDAVIVNSKNASESCQQIPTLQYDAIDLFVLWNAPGQLFGGPMCWENLHMCTVLLASRLERRDEGWEVKLRTAGLIGWISTTLREECLAMEMTILSSLTSRILDSRGRFWGWATSSHCLPETSENWACSHDKARWI